MHPCSHGFISKKSIKTNASIHLGQSEIFKLDLMDFFPSIGLDRVVAVFRNFGYLPNVAFYLAALCCLNRRLPQGGAASPALSNIITRRLDARLYGLAKKFGLRYTRYADDIVMSGDRIPRKVMAVSRQIISEEGFRIRENKTRLYRGGRNVIITGLRVSGDELRVPRKFKREVRRDVHFICNKGYWDHINNRKLTKPFYAESVLGKLTFWRWIEPDDVFVQKYFDRFHKIVYELRREGK